jgi:hypothetical protein
MTCASRWRSCRGTRSVSEAQCRAASRSTMASLTPMRLVISELDGEARGMTYLPVGVRVE